MKRDPPTRRASFLPLAAAMALAMALAMASPLWALEKIKLAYSSPGGAAIISAAISEGYFADEGFEVEPLSLTAPEISQKIASGEIKGGEINHLGLKLASHGAPLIFTAGLYGGFVEILAGPSWGPGHKPILAVQDLASGPAVAAARYFRSEGIDPDADIGWLETDDPLAALESSEASALARWEFKRHEAAHGHDHGHAPADEPTVLFGASASLPAHSPADDGGNPHAKHTSAHHLFESFVVLPATLAESDPASAAAITRALIRGARRVGENPSKAADLATGLWGGPREPLEAEIARYMWMPGVSHAKEHLRYYIHEGIKRGALAPNLDEKAFFGRVFSQALPDLN
ncbi:MAG: hypothetical protein LBF58_09380 [Deltaproteobacteria bacterium]|jgi:ABC-type nitrate/sulfonate/bicarbonate transport system substrate-binding protein|nr:hypothetical protein [Deltaproteobacteria bacterium]